MKSVVELLPLLSGARTVGRIDRPVVRVHTDTRSLQPGDLFVALKGERFDAHDFLAQAQAVGAAAVLAERGLAEAGLSGVEVPDSHAALMELAARWRSQFAMPLVAVTGSNGKTTVTQMVASILRAAVGGDGGKAHATQGNLNNDIGVPLTLLRLRAQHRLSVVELGMNHPGEIERLACMAAPTVALVNNAQREHQEFMATVEAVARENGQVIRALGSDGTAVFPSDDTYTPLWQEMAGTLRTLTFSDTDTRADVHALAATWEGDGWFVHLHTPAGDAGVRLRIAGRHNVRNALAATACALAAGVGLPAVVQGLQDFEPVGGRSRTVSLTIGGRPVTLVDDTYNANPDSVRAAIDVLAELPGPQLLVLGDMGEVGDQGLAFHLEVLRHATTRGLRTVHVAGTHMANASLALAAGGEPSARHWTDVAELAGAMASAVTCTEVPVRSILVKGSRFMRMERVVQAIVALDPDSPTRKDSSHAA